MPEDKEKPKPPTPKEPAEKRDEEWGGPRKPIKAQALPTKQSVMENLDWVTDRLSNQVRTVAIGVLALSWGLLVGNSTAAKAVSEQQLLMIGLLAVVVMFCDFLQYVFGYQNTFRLYQSMQQQGLETARYPDDWFYRGRKFCFYAKQWLAGASVVWLGALVVKAVI